MNLQTMEDWLDTITKEAALKPFYADWLNDALFELALDFEFPTLKRLLPETVTVDDSTWVWSMPSDYHKKLFRCAFVDTDGRQKEVTVFDRREDLEYRDHTQTGPNVTAVAVAQQGELFNLLIDPLPTASVDLLTWYYKKPTVMTLPADYPACMPPEYHERVLIPRVMIKNYEYLVDQVVNPNFQGLQYWQAKEERGLRGDGSHVGLIDYFNKSQGPPRRAGGRDPIGRGGWGRRGY